jgi:putative transcriptional regulator
VVDAHVDDILTHDPAHLWATVLRRQKGEMAWYANHPEDPSAN